MIIGVTATQKGLTDKQLSWAAYFLSRASGLEHGDCIGGDKQLHELMLSLHPGGTHIGIHPPDDSKKRAWCTGPGVVLYDPKPYQDRNHDIVNTCDMMLVFPHNYSWYPHSGTWSTDTYSQNAGRVTIRIFPDGSLQPV